MKLDVAYGSNVVLFHDETNGGYLHSHPYQYPAGSKQQQVTLYPHIDLNNNFMIKKPLRTIESNFTEGEIVGFTKIEHGNIIRLEHVMTKSRLHSHDIR